MASDITARSNSDKASVIPQKVGRKSREASPSWPELPNSHRRDRQVGYFLWRKLEKLYYCESLVTLPGSSHHDGFSALSAHNRGQPPDAKRRTRTHSPSGTPAHNLGKSSFSSNLHHLASYSNSYFKMSITWILPSHDQHGWCLLLQHFVPKHSIGQCLSKRDRFHSTQTCWIINDISRVQPTVVEGASWVFLIEQNTFQVFLRGQNLRTTGAIHLVDPCHMNLSL